MTFTPQCLNLYAVACFIGQLDTVIAQMESGQAPSLSTHETPFQTSYVSLVILGAQHLEMGPNMVHEGTLRYLLSKGCPVDSGDTTGLTSLHHICQRAFKPTLTLCFPCRYHESKAWDWRAHNPERQQLCSGALISIEVGHHQSPATIHWNQTNGHL